VYVVNPKQDPDIDQFAGYMGKSGSGEAFLSLCSGVKVFSMKPILDPPLPYGEQAVILPQELIAHILEFGKLPSLNLSVEQRRLLSSYASPKLVHGVLPITSNGDLILTQTGTR